MSRLESQIKKLIPKGGEYYGIVSSYGDTLIASYGLDNKTYTIPLKKVSLTKLCKEPITIKYTTGLTYEKIYENINNQYGLELTEDDYYCKGEINFINDCYINLPVKETSHSYTGEFKIYLYKTAAQLVANDWKRDLRGLGFPQTFKDQALIQSKLNCNVFQIDVDMFKSSILTITMKETVKTYLAEMNSDLVEDLIIGHVEKAFNDGLSDIVLIITPQSRKYFLRFKTPIGDLPK